MKIKLLTAGAFLAALAMPLGVCAQQSQYPYPSSQAPSEAGKTPSGARMQERWARRFGNLNLSGDQQQHIRSLIDQYSQAHPEGSPRDRRATRELRRQIMGVLTDDQQNQYRQAMRARRAQLHREQQPGQGQQYQGQPNGGPPPDQGQPPNQGPPA
jgi:Spy/CpxP family protein refolding chaperone